MIFDVVRYKRRLAQVAQDEIPADWRTAMRAGYHANWPGIGKPARFLIRAYQKKHSIPQTGKFDAATMTVLYPPSARDRILKVARHEIGVKESPPNSNDGPRVRQYEATTGAYRQPWCASFAKWVFTNAGVKATPQMTADVTTWLGFPHTKNPQPGDAVIYQWDSGDVDHIGIFEKGLGEGAFDAIEGNTSYGNDSNGGEVMVRTRSVANVAAFVRVV